MAVQLSSAENIPLLFMNQSQANFNLFKTKILQLFSLIFPFCEQTERSLPVGCWSFQVLEISHEAVFKAVSHIMAG